MSSAFEHSVFLLKLYYVSSLHSASAFRYIIRNCLSLFESLEALALDCRKMYEYIRSVLTGNKTIAFFCVEPLYCTLVHLGTS